MYKNQRIVCMIPARGGSKRLKNKNIMEITGRPMISYAIDKAKSSKFIDEVYVSTEDKKIAEIAEKFDAKIVVRPIELAKDNISTQDVMKHFAENIVEFDVLVLIQANSPQVKKENIDKAIGMLVDRKLWEVRSVDSDGLENGAFWIVKRETIKWDGLSVYFGVVEDDAIDIHYQKDLDLVREMMKNGS
ncbi:MAG: acylneuraminate cytidylyltransferase family protein [Nanoarchaeota archaeon]|nr:acylneuraminate cytidylyltransferase family protein [Nanoarchaeota archaeon]